jgi:hypothetical protein
MTMPPFLNTPYQYNHYSQPMPPQPVAPRETVPAEISESAPKASVSDGVFRNGGAMLNGATLGVVNLITEPIRHVWNYAKKGAPEAVAVLGGGVALGYGAVSAASAGTLFPLLAGGLALAAGIQLVRGGYGAFTSETPKEQQKGFNRVGQALTLSALAGVSLLHYTKFWHAPKWGSLWPNLSGGMKEISTKSTQFFNAVPQYAETAWKQTQGWVGGLQNKAAHFWGNLKNPPRMS